MADKLLAEWFWTDRWMGSSGFLLPIAPRGLYREMLTQAWRRGARLPNDHEAIRRAVGSTTQEWNRYWPRIRGYWRVDGDYLVPTEDFGRACSIPGQTSHRRHIPLDIRRAVFARDGCACVSCGATDLLELDHIKPYSRGGADTVENLRVLCKPCNIDRGAPEVD